MKKEDIKSFICLFYDNDILTEDGLELSEICEESFCLDEDGLLVRCFDPENKELAVLKDKTCNVTIELHNGVKIVLEKCKIDITKIPLINTKRNEVKKMDVLKIINIK